MADLGAGLNRRSPGATFLWTETPTNPHLTLVDLAAIGKLAAGHGVPWACDNTFASPLLQHPIDFGAVASMHSATKYVGGHSDVIMGVAIVADADLAPGSARTPQPDPARNPTGSPAGSRGGGCAGNAPAPGPSAIGQRVRTRDPAERAPTLKTSSTPVSPTIPITTSPRGRCTAASAGCSPSSSRGPDDQAVIDHCQVWTPATSLGGVESLIEHGAKWTGESAGPALLRCSTGIEDVEVIVERSQGGTGE